jgi:hypothetical protein
LEICGSGTARVVLSDGAVEEWRNRVLLARSRDWGLEADRMTDTGMSKHRSYPRLLAAVACALVVQPILWAGAGHAAGGNDTFVNESAGNLHFLKNYSVAIRSERLVVGPPARPSQGGLWQIPFHVEYDLENLTVRPVHATVGFPVPPCDLQRFVSATHLAYITGDESTCVKRPTMTLAVDGRAITDGQWELVFTLDGKPLDNSPGGAAIASGARLVAAAVMDPEVSFYPNDADYLEKAASLCRLLGDSLKGSECAAFHRIAVYNTFIWKHDFAPKSHTRVVHDYLVQASLNVPAERDFSFDAFCLKDKSVAAAYSRYQQRPLDDRGFDGLFYTEYVLHTGAMWAAPIGEFELVIRKASPGQVVSTCFQDLERQSAVEFRAHRRDYTPTEDLRVLYFEIGKAKD